MDDSAEWQSLHRLTTLVVGQGCFWGGGLQVLPGAVPTDGLMDVVALQGLGLADLILRGGWEGCMQQPWGGRGDGFFLGGWQPWGGCAPGGEGVTQDCSWGGCLVFDGVCCPYAVQVTSCVLDGTRL